MADWKKVEAQLRKTINDANQTTGKNDTNITDCVDRLISGYGQGAGGGIADFINGTSTIIKDNGVTQITLTLFSGTNVASVEFPKCTTITNSAFQNCKSLKTANFPSCTNIGSYAFSSCSSLTTVSFPSCTNIGSYAFAYCRSLTEVSFPSCSWIGSYAFYGCASLTSVSFPKCSYVNSMAFYNCTLLESIYLMSTSV